MKIKRLLKACALVIVVSSLAIFGAKIITSLGRTEILIVIICFSFIAAVYSFYNLLTTIEEDD